MSDSTAKPGNGDEQTEEPTSFKAEVVETGAFICTFEAQVICQRTDRTDPKTDLYGRLTKALEEVVGSGGTVGNAVMHSVPLFVRKNQQPEPINKPTL